MLELKNVSFGVQDDGGTKEIIKNVSFTVEDGSFTVVTGPNGGGKSTLAKLIMGIEKPDSGQIRAIFFRVRSSWKVLKFN